MISKSGFSRVGPGLLVLAVLWLAAVACGLPTASIPPEAATVQPGMVSVTQPPGEPLATDGNQVSEVTIFLVALEDGGASGPAIGCGNSLVAVTRPVGPTDRPIEAALNELFAIQEQFYGESGLYTALYQSDLVVESALVDASGVATVALSGPYMLGGACDTPRFAAQIEQTVLAAPGVNAVNILLNGQALEEALSTR